MSDELNLFNLYIEETREHLDHISECLLELERAPESMDRINDLFRSVHTIKGSTATMGYNHTSRLIHKAEDLIQALRDGKLSANEKIIQILLVTHDHMENFIEIISKGGGEEELRISHIFEELCNIVDNCYTEKPVKEKTEKEAGIRLSDDDYSTVLDWASRGKYITMLSIRLSADCVFRAVRGWMAFEEVEKECEVLASLPDKPTADEFKDGSFDLDSDNIDMIIASDKNAAELEALLGSQLLEVDYVYSGEIRVEDGILQGKNLIFDEIAGLYLFDHAGISAQTPAAEEAAADSMPETQYSPEFIYEIKENVKKAEVAFLGLSAGGVAPAELGNLYKTFHSISGLAGYIEFFPIYEISRETEVLTDIYRKHALDVDETLTSLVTDSIRHIKALSECESVNHEECRYDEMTAHLHLLKSNVQDLQDRIGHKADKNTDKGSAKEGNKKLGEILADRGKVDLQTIDEMIALQKEKYPEMKLGQILVHEEKVPLDDIKEAIAIQEKARTENRNVNLVRIPEYKIDNLVDMLGELIILQSLHKEDVGTTFSTGDTSRLYNNIGRMERITKELQDISMSLRMVSLKQTFQKLLRIGRDTSKQLDRDVEFELIGEDTEIDRGVVEKLHDPLMHILRNAISHGIESSEKREKQGKSRTGNVRMLAYNKKGYVHIEVSDDGKGLDLDRILEKAVENGLAQNRKAYSENEITGFIFLPGFSTQEQVDSISGRGVGMNVVETEIKKIGGRIEVKSIKDKGSVFIMKIPVNLATINGTVVDILGERYILPTMNVKRIFKPEPGDWISIRGKYEMIRNRDDILKLVDMQSFLSLKEKGPDYCGNIMVVVEHEGGLRALPADAVLGKQEVVIKPLESDFRNLGFLSGATILGDGKVSFILDVESFYQNTQIDMI